MSDKKALFIINRYSGSGFRPNLEGKIIAACNKREIECFIEFTNKPGHGTTLAKMAVKKGFNVVFAVGGDGTVNEVAHGLLHTSIPLGIIPKGSGNGLARHLRIPLRTEQALDLLDQQNVINIDTFMINDRLSLNVSGIGFDGCVAQQFGKDGKRGLFSYGRIVVKNFVRCKEFDLQLSIDSENYHERAFIISIANSSQFGNNATIAPSASICDHLLNIPIVKKMNVLQGLRFVAQLFKGDIEKSRWITMRKGASINISLGEEQPFHVDGEPAGSASHFEIKINPASLRMVVPLGVQG